MMGEHYKVCLDASYSTAYSRHFTDLQGNIELKSLWCVKNDYYATVKPVYNGHTLKKHLAKTDRKIKKFQDPNLPVYSGHFHLFLIIIIISLYQL